MPLNELWKEGRKERMKGGEGTGGRKNKKTKNIENLKLKRKLLLLKAV